MENVRSPPSIRTHVVARMLMGKLRKTTNVLYRIDFTRKNVPIFIYARIRDRI